MPRKTVSIRELRNRTADVVKRVEDGETLSLTVNGRPVAEIGPPDPRGDWAPASAIRAIADQAPADRGLLEERNATIDEL